MNNYLVAAQTKKCQSKRNVGGGGCGDPKCPQGLAISQAFAYAIEHDDYSLYEQVSILEDQHKKAAAVDDLISEMPVVAVAPAANIPVAPKVASVSHSNFYQDMEYDVWPIPQASDLEKVSSVVDSISNNATTAQAIAEALGTVEREGGYYANAAGYIGLVEKYEDDQNLTQYGLTTAGQTFFNLTPEERGSMLSEMINQTPVAQTYLDSKSPEDFEKQLMASGKTNLTDVTAKRRASSFSSWMTQLKDTKGLSDTLGKQQAETISRSILASRNQQIAREERKSQVSSTQKLEGGTCPTCFMIMPVSGICPECN